MSKPDVEVELRGLLLRSLDGDETAYRRFLQRLAAHLRAWVGRRLFGWPDDVEDLVQECLLAVHNQRHTYQPDQVFVAWVQAIARYKLIDLLRARSGREALHVPLDDELAVFAASDTEASDARRDVMGMLHTLPDKQRRPIECVKIEGLSVAETARLTGLSESAVKVGIHRGLKALALRFAQACSTVGDRA
jgi:RNA polymerase sigma-70 factor (ECF subfamily)